MKFSGITLGFPAANSTPCVSEGEPVLEGNGKEMKGDHILVALLQGVKTLK